MKRFIGILSCVLFVCAMGVGRNSNAATTTENSDYVQTVGSDAVKAGVYTLNAGLTFEYSIDGDIGAFENDYHKNVLLVVVKIMPIEHNCRELTESTGDQPTIWSTPTNETLAYNTPDLRDPFHVILLC